MIFFSIRSIIPEAVLHCRWIYYACRWQRVENRTLRCDYRFQWFSRFLHESFRWLILNAVTTWHHRRSGIRISVTVIFLLTLLWSCFCRFFMLLNNEINDMIEFRRRRRRQRQRRRPRRRRRRRRNEVNSSFIQRLLHARFFVHKSGRNVSKNRIINPEFLSTTAHRWWIRACGMGWKVICIFIALGHYSNFSFSYHCSDEVFWFNVARR